MLDEAKSLLQEKKNLDDEHPQLLEKMKQLEESTQQKQLRIADMEAVYRQIIIIKAQFEEIEAKNANKKKAEEEEEEINAQIIKKGESEDGDFSIPD